MPDIKSDATIFDLWSKDESAVKKEAKELAFKVLRSEAEVYISEKQLEVFTAREAYNEARMKSLKTKKFGPIAEARMSLRVAEKIAEEAILAYKEEFKASPQISM